jgi:DDE superfamily endonuclease
MNVRDERFVIDACSTPLAGGLAVAATEMMRRSSAVSLRCWMSMKARSVCEAARLLHVEGRSIQRMGPAATPPGRASRRCFTAPAKAVRLIGTKNWRASCNLPWSNARETSVAQPQVGLCRSCSRCSLAPGMKRSSLAPPPSPAPSPSTRLRLEALPLCACPRPAAGEKTPNAFCKKKSGLCPLTRRFWRRTKPIFCFFLRCARAGWAGLGWAGLGWAGLGWAGLGWARRGEPAPVPISGFNARRSAVFGTLNLRTGHMLLLEEKHRRAQEFQLFLELIYWHCRAWPVALLLEENPCHTAHTSQALAEELNIRLLWLPKRSPHLNSMEHLWRHGKATVCANCQHATLQEESRCFTNCLQSLSSKERIHKAGVLSKNFWLQLQH